jgi:CBS domain-containing protein
MKTSKVMMIIRPCWEKLPMDYTVTPEDKIMHSVELMVENNLKEIAVVRGGRPIGMVRLDDALKRLGINTPLKKK